MKASHTLLSVLTLLGFSLEGRTQDLLYEIEALPYGVSSMYGSTDVNNDGINDLIVGSTRENDFRSAGYVRAYNGADGQQLWNKHLTEAFGWSISEHSDIDADGVNDVIVGQPGIAQERGAVVTLSGSNGANLNYLTGKTPGNLFGFSVSRLKDINGDDIDEIIVGEPKADNPFSGINNTGKVYVFSGADGAEIYSWYGDGVDDDFGCAVAGIGDINGDGTEDVAVGAPLDDNQLEDSGSVRIFSGATGEVLVFAINGESSSDHFGAQLCRISDLNTDGVGDLLVSAPLNYGAAGPLIGAVYGISGADSSAIFHLEGAVSIGEFGTAIAAIGDLNTDGVEDFIVQSGNILGGPAQVFSGFNGTQLTNLIYEGDGSTMQSRGAVTGLGDINGDGYQDFAVGWRKIYVYAGDPFLGENYCNASAHTGGLAARIGATGSPSVSANNLSLQVIDAVPNQFGLFYYGKNRSEVPFGYGWRCVGGTKKRLEVLSTDASGNAQLLFDNTDNSGVPPSLQIYENGTFNFQFWFRDPAAGAPAFNLSDAVEITFYP